MSVTHIKKKSGWTAYGYPKEVIPNDDLKEHEFGEKCWCKPWQDKDVLVHNAADGRTEYEN